MPIDTSGETGERQAYSPAGHDETEYLEWGPPESPVVVRMHLDAVNGIARDVIEGVNASPRRDLEVGGLLLGRVTGSDRQVVWIERYQRVSCDHTFGSHFILDDSDAAALEHAAAGVFATRETAVVGLYRSHTRPGLQLEESDFDLIRRYFSDPSDLVLLVKPVKEDILVAEFYRFDPDGGAQPVGERFAFSGNAVTPDTQLVTPDTERTVAEAADALSPMAEKPVSTESEPPMRSDDTHSDDRPSGDRPRRLVPDFAPWPVEPAPSVFGLSDPARQEAWPPPDQTEDRSGNGGLKKWLPLVAAVVLVGGIVWFLLQPGQKGAAPSTPAQTAESVRPLGLYVDPLAQTWRVLWNPNATALHEARHVVLFVREGDDQKLIEPSPRDLAAGSYEYRPTGNDVTFRLEVTEKGGRVSAESFRLVKSGPADATLGAQPPLPKAGAPALGPSVVPPPVPAPARIVQPKPIYRAPPVVAAGIRPRIKGTIPIDVKVRIDERGRVISATTITKVHDGLDKYLATRALQAARQWKFQPARENGIPVAGTQTIHFVFTK